MGTQGVKVIPRPIKIHGQEIDTIKAILLPIGLQLHEKGFFSNTVGGVGFFGVAVPKIAFFEGNRGKFGIGANRPHTDEFLDSRAIGTINELCPHHQVVIKEFSGLDLIEANSPHMGSKVNDNILVLNDGLASRELA